MPVGVRRTVCGCEEIRHCERQPEIERDREAGAIVVPNSAKNKALARAS
jgi:hypothetical protein